MINKTIPIIEVTPPRFIPELRPTLEELQAQPVPEEFYSLTGPLTYRPTNDALFHIMLEANSKALKALLCSLLRMKPEEIKTIIVRNPIDFGKKADAKDLIMDMKICLNNDTDINIEMQVAYFAYWRERSISYLCRCYDSLNQGTKYSEQHKAIHIGILNFNLVGKEPALFSTFHLTDDSTHEIYSDKLELSVLQLVHKELATTEDKLWHLDTWASFFTATTWEEVFALSEKNEHIANLAKTMYTVTQDERVRFMCEQRLESEKTRIAYEEDVQRAEQKANDATHRANIAEHRADIAEQRADVAEQQLAYLLTVDPSLQAKLEAFQAK
ncbi:MAG: Rpn family recombination-promoting nuclease/putative transposase [Lachnospiraceae bacterium]|nr:Rpn family recombination-promoting nuclease/putative transposase [Lachnospiraceae bacterium]